MQLIKFLVVLPVQDGNGQTQTENMEISGNIIRILPEKSGEGRNGPWRKQEFILETEDQYPKKVCIALWGDRIDQYDLKEGERITASVNIESREFNERWYTDVKAWRISRDSAPVPGEPGMSPANEPPPFDAPPPTDEPPDSSGEDDLPF